MTALPIVSDVSGWAVAASMGVFLVMSVVRGWLIPRKTYLDMKEERNTWRDAKTASDKTVSDQAAALYEQRVTSRAVTHVLQNLPLAENPEDDADAQERQH